MWRIKETLSFIKDFRLNECLWNVKNEDYKNRGKKENALALLSEKYRIEVKDVERKISNLRAQFRREHKKMVLNRKESLTSKNMWFAYKPLLFLTSVSEEIETIEDQHCPAIKDAEESNAEVEAYPLTTNGTLESSLAVKATECLKTLTETIYKRDDFAIYGDYIAAKLRNSGRSKKEIAIAQYHMEEVVFNLVMGFYREEQEYAQTFMAPETYTTPQTHIVPQGSVTSYTHISSETKTISVPSSTNIDCNN